MSTSTSFVCIVCPRGCHLEVSLAPGPCGEGVALSAVAGNACRRGEDYARAEISDPRRSLTSTVRVSLEAGAACGGRRRLPVRSSAPIPLPRLREAARALDSILVTGPLACGEVVAKDILGLGVDIVATDSLERSA